MKKLLVFILIFAFVLSSFSAQPDVKKLGSKSNIEIVRILSGLSVDELIGLLNEVGSMNDFALRDRVFFLAKIAISQNDPDGARDILTKVSSAIPEFGLSLDSFFFQSTAFNQSALTNLQAEEIQPAKSKPFSADSKL